MDDVDEVDGFDEAADGADDEADIDVAPAADDTPWPPMREPVLVARPYGGGGSMGGTTPSGPLPGAYLPPNSMMPALAGTNGSMAAVALAPDPGDADPAAARAGGVRLADVLPGLAPERMTEIAGWFVVVGSSMAVLGFLLPWSVMVVGARGSGGYLDDWGLASPTHMLIVVGLLGVLALGVLETPVPAWLRTGVLGLGLGGLLVGLTWPYLFGPLGAGIGVADHVARGGRPADRRWRRELGDSSRRGGTGRLTAGRRREARAQPLLHCAVRIPAAASILGPG